MPHTRTNRMYQPKFRIRTTLIHSMHVFKNEQESDDEMILWGANEMHYPTRTNETWRKKKPKWPPTIVLFIRSLFRYVFIFLSSIVLLLAKSFAIRSVVLRYDTIHTHTHKTHTERERESVCICVYVYLVCNAEWMVMHVYEFIFVCSLVVTNSPQMFLVWPVSPANENL